MLKFSEWQILQERQLGPGQIMVSGPGVHLLQTTFSQMGERGAPTERNDYGFNHQDWQRYQQFVANRVLEMPAIPVQVVVEMLKVLRRYSNTQVKNYSQIESLAKEDIKKVSPEHAGEDDEKVVVYDREPRRPDGKVRIYVPGGVAHIVRAINAIIDQQMDQEKEEKVIDNYGNLKHQRIKKMSQDTSGKLNSYFVHPSVLSKLLELFKSKGMEARFQSGATSFSADADASVLDTPRSDAPDIVVLGFEDTTWGKRLAIQSDKLRKAYDEAERLGLRPKAIKYQYDGNKYMINPQRDFISKIIDLFKRHGIDTSPIEEAISKTTTTEPAVDSGDPITFLDAPENQTMIKLNYRALSETKKQFLKESVRYTFPEYHWDGDKFGYVVRGNYKQYANFDRILTRFKYDTTKLKEIIEKKISEGRLEKTGWEGEHDDNEKFLSSIQSRFPEIKVDLYDAQKRGIAFLYGRNHAILGDSTGLGKTIQLICAAELKMREIKKPTLIITYNTAVQRQFANEIPNVMGEAEKHKISVDPSNPEKWTIATYDNFCKGKKISSYMEALKEAGFGVVILDELHKTKHEDSKTSANIVETIKDVPIRWGATATLSSNKAMDIRHQLIVTGHHLGRIKKGTFQRDFAAMQPTGYRGAYEDGPFEDRVRAAERLNKWLVLSGLYIRRNKEDVREMPNIQVAHEEVGIDKSKFNEFYLNKLEGYENPRLAISRLAAARETLAHMKTNETTRRVLEIVSKNKDKPENNYAASKIVVFTNFVEAAKQLVSKIQEGLKSIDPRYSLLEYLGDTKEADRKLVKSKFSTDPNVKVLVMSLRTGGTGIDFPNAAQNMVINDFDWTPESAEQSEGRIYRINTTHPVNIQYVVAEGIDRDLYETLQRKRELAAIIQRYRLKYHDSEEDDESLDKIVELTVKMQKEQEKASAKINKELPGAGDAVTESFSQYMNNIQEIFQYLNGML